MNKIFKNIRKQAGPACRQAGFTLIELLVVIGILGILAAALIATIDPFEQLKKAQDANSKNTAVEFNDAIIRYYTTHNAFPWTANIDSACTAQMPATFTGTNLTAMTNCQRALVTDGELKPGFTGATDILRTIFVTSTNNDIIACFKPVSKSQQRDPNTKYDVSGVVTSGCVSTSGQEGTYCYWCAK